MNDKIVKIVGVDENGIVLIKNTKIVTAIIIDEKYKDKEIFYIKFHSLEPTQEMYARAKFKE